MTPITNKTEISCFVIASENYVIYFHLICLVQTMLCRFPWQIVAVLFISLGLFSQLSNKTSVFNEKYQWPSQYVFKYTRYNVIHSHFIQIIRHEQYRHKHRWIRGNRTKTPTHLSPCKGQHELPARQTKMLYYTIIYVRYRRGDHI